MKVQTNQNSERKKHISRNLDVENAKICGRIRWLIVSNSSLIDRNQALDPKQGKKNPSCEQVDVLNGLEQDISGNSIERQTVGP